MKNVLRCFTAKSYFNFPLVVFVFFAFSCNDEKRSETNTRASDSSTNTSPTREGGGGENEEQAQPGSISKTLFILSMSEADYRRLRDAPSGNSSQIAFQYYVEANSDELTLKAWSGKNNDEFEANPVVLETLIPSTLDISTSPFNLAIQKLTRRIISRITLTPTLDDELLIFYPYSSSDGIRYQIQVIQASDKDRVSKDRPAGLVSITTNPAPPGIFNNSANDVP